MKSDMERLKRYVQDLERDARTRWVNSAGIEDDEANWLGHIDAYQKVIRKIDVHLAPKRRKR